MTGFKGMTPQGLFAKHQIKGADSQAIAKALSFPESNWTVDQVEQIVKVANEAAAQGVAIKQYLQGAAQSTSGSPEVNISALTAAAVTPAVRGTQAALQTVQQGMSQIVEQGSDAIVQMSSSVVPAMLAMAAEKGSGPAAMAQAEAVQAEVAKTFGTFRIPAQLRTALPTTGNVGALAGGLKPANADGEGN